jgi:hypothetical protein
VWKKGICKECNKILKNLELGRIHLFRNAMYNNRNIFVRIKSHNRRTRKNYTQSIYTCTLHVYEPRSIKSSSPTPVCFQQESKTKENHKRVMNIFANGYRRKRWYDYSHKHQFYDYAIIFCLLLCIVMSEAWHSLPVKIVIMTSTWILYNNSSNSVSLVKKERNEG